MRQLLRITATLALALVFSAGMAFGQNNDATVDQVGDDNEANVEQTGSNNEATVFQSKNASTLGIKIFTGSAGHHLELSQDGAGHIAQISQGGTNTEATIEQLGSNNLLNADDYRAGLASGIGVKNSSIDVLQDGVNNTGRITQQGKDFSTILTQEGNDNEANISMRSSVGRLSEDFTVNVTQEGDRNHAEVSQNYTDPVGPASVTLDQIGDDNYASFQQAETAIGATGGGGKSNSAMLTQDGNENVSRLSQSVSKVGDLSEATITQDGNENVLAGLSGSPSFARQDNSTLTLIQSGNANSAYVDQTDGTATITQSGTANTATVEQQP